MTYDVRKEITTTMETLAHDAEGLDADAKFYEGEAVRAREQAAALRERVTAYEHTLALLNAEVPVPIITPAP